jgi:3-hydroxyacyl-[acyl-carrier-protein] dehydratase
VGLSLTETLMDVKEIQKRIPHRYPFLFVDKVLSIDLLKGTISAIKVVSINEPFFQGHFPNLSIMPGVLIIEALAQASAIYVAETGMKGMKVLASVKSFKFRRPVSPGDTLHLEVKVLHLSVLGGKCEGVASVDGKICAEGQLTFSVVKAKEKDK